ncbi:MAG: hypothetical protein M3R63_16285, partial [Actinomycetota bacterium]|nr:hypothetical protein [Actinomycetota bacterium]
MAEDDQGLPLMQDLGLVPGDGPVAKADANPTLQDLMLPTLQSGAPASGSSGGGRFTVMPDQIPAAIGLFEQARSDMEQL